MEYRAESLHADRLSEGDDYLNTTVVARRYGRSLDTIYRWVRTGRFPAPTKLNGRNYWRQGDLRDWEQISARQAAEVAA